MNTANTSNTSPAEGSAVETPDPQAAPAAEDRAAPTQASLPDVAADLDGIRLDKTPDTSPDRSESRSEEARSRAIYAALARAIYLATGVFLALWFLEAITLAALFFAVVGVAALALNPPVTWLEARRVPRAVGTLLVLAAILGLTGAMGWLVVPRLGSEALEVSRQIPGYINTLQERAASLLAEYPEVGQRLRGDNGDALQGIMPAAQNVLARAGRTSLSLVAVVVFGLLGLTALAYTLAQPRPLLRSLLNALPARSRDKATRAWARGSQSVTGWLWSNVIIGAIEAAAAWAVLSALGVPGAPVWAALTFFAELVPQVGAYLMAAPPILVALAIDPQKALWVLLFYIALQQVTGTLIAPMVQGRQMKLHPVSLLFSVLALGSVFGILGALIATPVVGIIKAFYDEFYGQGREDEHMEPRVEAMLLRDEKWPESRPESAKQAARS